jgi:membrane protease YdiL (CAAX protease family)
MDKCADHHYRYGRNRDGNRNVKEVVDMKFDAVTVPVLALAGLFVFALPADALASSAAGSAVPADPYQMLLAGSALVLLSVLDVKLFKRPVERKSRMRKALFAFLAVGLLAFTGGWVYAHSRLPDLVSGPLKSVQLKVFGDSVKTD